MVYTRGASDDFERYAKHTGDSGWGWDNIKSYISKVRGGGAISFPIFTDIQSSTRNGSLLQITTTPQANSLPLLTEPKVSCKLVFRDSPLASTTRLLLRPKNFQTNSLSTRITTAVMSSVLVRELSSPLSIIPGYSLYF